MTMYYVLWKLCKYGLHPLLISLWIVRKRTKADKGIDCKLIYILFSTSAQNILLERVMPSDKFVDESLDRRVAWESKKESHGASNSGDNGIEVIEEIFMGNLDIVVSKIKVKCKSRIL